MMTKQEIESGLRNFYGTEGYTRYNFGILMTDGVTWLCKVACSFWLVDAIGAWQSSPKVQYDEMLQGIQFWTLKVNHTNNTAELILERDSNDVVLVQKIGFTDFPLDEIKLYYSPADKVLLLPGEY